ncbi:MAG: alkane 1-monooxygenase [Rhodobacterales bacterium]|nr:alkane 1-monooxygenase [Rhodobacterales bacterium]MDX5413376.1 alkane 1-monooxygenase [Rhodobacterales bacterium]
MFLFVIATLAPLALLIPGALWGGWWIPGGIFLITVFTWAADHLMRHAAAVTGRDDEFPSGDGLAVTLALLLLAGLVLTLRAFGAGFSGLELLGLVIGWGLAFGQIGHPVAHELIHRRPAWMRLLGRAVYAAVLMGHHASSHLRVHHVHVGSADDPASAPLGMGFWTYAPRAWGGSFMAGLRAETALRARAATPAPIWTHPYLGYAAGALLALGLAFGLGGLAGGLALLGIAGYAQLQILLSDYIQHYGLTRARLADGRLEPVGARHSWNAPRHSDHHAHPARAYPALRLDQEMPLLPRAVPVMAVAALIPPLWRRMMDRRAMRWMAR